MGGAGGGRRRMDQVTIVTRPVVNGGDKTMNQCLLHLASREEVTDKRSIC